MLPVISLVVECVQKYIQETLYKTECFLVQTCGCSQAENIVEIIVKPLLSNEQLKVLLLWKPKNPLIESVQKVDIHVSKLEKGNWRTYESFLDSELRHLCNLPIHVDRLKEEMDKFNKEVKYEENISHKAL